MPGDKEKGRGNSPVPHVPLLQYNELCIYPVSQWAGGYGLGVLQKWAGEL